MIQTQIAKPRKNLGRAIQARMQQIFQAKEVILTLYVNKKCNSRVAFTRTGRFPEMTDDFFSLILSDFAELSRRLAFNNRLIIGDMLTANVQFAKENLEVIIAHATDDAGNELHLCYMVA